MIVVERGGEQSEGLGEQSDVVDQRSRVPSRKKKREGKRIELTAKIRERKKRVKDLCGPKPPRPKKGIT